MSRRNLTISVLLAATILSACEAPAVQEASDINAAATTNVNAMMDKSFKPLPSDAGRISVNREVFVGANAKKLRTGSPLPSAVETGGVTLFSGEMLDIYQIGDLIYDATNISVNIAEDAARAIQNSAATRGTDTLLTVSHKGRLSNFLDKVANRFDLSWKYNGTEITFFHSETDTYLINLLPSAMSAEMDISGGAGEDDSGVGTASQSTTSSYAIDLWGDVTNSITALVGEEGMVTTSLSTGTVSITASPSVLSRVGTYIQQQNERLSKQVSISVQVYNVAMNSSTDLSTDLSAEIAKGMLSGSIGGSGGPGDSNGELGWTLLNPIDGVSNLQGMVQLLSKKGNVSVVTTANATTLNNVPTPIQVGNSRSYVSTVNQVVDAETGQTSTEVEIGKVNTGFNMQLLPRILSDGVVALQYNIATSELVGANDGFDQVNSGGQQIQLPNLNTRAFTQQVAIPTGQTLILSGFDQATTRTDKSGIGKASNWLTGGKQAASVDRNSMVIAITPVILDVRAAIERIE